MHHEQEHPRGAPLWCISFGDLMSLLLGFFIMLYALSGSKKEKDFDRFAEAMQRQFGFGDGNGWYPGPDREFGPQIGNPNGRPTGRDEENIGKRPASENNPQTRLLVPSSRDAHLGVAVFFAEDSSAVPEDKFAELKAFAEKVKGKPQKIEIRGHASGAKPGQKSGLRDAWDLAYERSHATMRYLVQEAGLEPERVRLSASGPNERFLAGVSTNAEAARSRVEVFLLDELADANNEAAPAAPADWNTPE